MVLLWPFCLTVWPKLLRCGSITLVNKPTSVGPWTRPLMVFAKEAGLVAGPCNAALRSSMLPIND